MGPGPRLKKKKNLPDRTLTKVEKHCVRRTECLSSNIKLYVLL